MGVELTAEEAGDRATLAGLGVATYVAPTACKDPAHQPDHLTFEEVFEEPRRALTGLLGPNGAGKSTLLRLVAGVLRPDGGRALLASGSTWPVRPEVLEPVYRVHCLVLGHPETGRPVPTFAPRG